MKNKKKIIKISTIIICFILLISMFIKVDATSYENEKKDNPISFENVNTNVTTMTYDTSGPALTINKTVSMIIPLLMNITAIISILSFVIGIVCIIKKQIKKGIIFIIIAIIIFFISGMFSLIYHPTHNIMP